MSYARGLYWLQFELLMGYQDNSEGVRYQEDVYLHDHRHGLLIFLKKFISFLLLYLYVYPNYLQYL